MEYPLVMQFSEEKIMRKVPLPLVDNEPVIADEEQVPDSDDEQIIARPDGYYWQSTDGKQEFGPFDTFESALADMERADEEAPEPGETLEEAEDEIGLSGWIDPDTGEPAEGQSTPRFE